MDVYKDETMSERKNVCMYVCMNESMNGGISRCVSFSFLCGETCSKNDNLRSDVFFFFLRLCFFGSRGKKNNA